MKTVLSIDPGLRATGYAFFRAGKLSRAGIIRSGRPERAEAAAEIGRALAVEFHRPLDLLIVEVPQVYQARALKGDPNDLVSVALVAGSALQLPAHRQRAILPHAWKGNTPKDVTKSRVLLQLSASERKVVNEVDCPASLMHNVFDAIGIGQWAHMALMGGT